MDKQVKAYFDAVPGPRKFLAESLHQAVMECFPEATVDLKYNMPTYSYGEGWVAIAIAVDSANHGSLGRISPYYPK